MFVTMRGDRNPLIDTQQESAYSYLLGLYLGDGHLARMPRGVWRLDVTLDERYAGIVSSARAAMQAVRPANRVSVRSRHPAAAVVVSCYSKGWPELLPQHGPGRKHERQIRLASWQSGITARHPEDFIRGLVHSDGCRYIARQRTGSRVYAYARYAFSNRSDDIRLIFCSHLDLLGVHWTVAATRNIQIARRLDVETLDTFVGPKT